jgi:ActD protein
MRAPARRHPHVHGLIAEFDSPSALIEGSRRAREAGYRKMDAYTPYPIHELAEALGLPRTKLPVLVLAGGALGCATGLAMQWFATAVHYPLNIGGRPLASWPSYIPITFELTVLFAAITAVLGMLGLNRLPMPYHPVFNVPRFALASRDRFFLCIETTDPLYDPEKTRAFLSSLGAREVTEVEE